MSLIINQGGTGFVGADFSDLPGISVFGAFARVVRLNHINSKGYFSAFALRNRRDDDLSRRLTFSEVGRDAVAVALSLTSTATLDIASWLPFHCDSTCLEANWSFRYCLACLRQGFHSLLHQLPWIDRCPLHRTRLLTKCAMCGSSLTLRGDAKYRLLECSNGHDILNEMMSCADRFDQTEAAEEFMKGYLDWAGKERERCLLIPPEGGTTRFDVLGRAIVLPSALRDRCQAPRPSSPAIHARTLTLRPRSADGFHDVPSALAKLSTLCNEGAGLELPQMLAPGFISIGCGLAGRLPPESLTDAEVSLFFDGLSRQPDHGFKPAKRSSLSDIRFLPPLLIGERRVIHRSTLSKVVTRSAEQMLASTIGEHTHPDSQVDGGEHLLLFALAAILKRGYSEGMRIVLSRYIPSLFDSKRDRPRLTEPWVLIHKEGSQMRSVKILWAKRRGLP